jgi:hypothetical protein
MYVDPRLCEDVDRFATGGCKPRFEICGLRPEIAGFSVVFSPAVLRDCIPSNPETSLGGKRDFLRVADSPPGVANFPPFARLCEFHAANTVLPHCFSAESGTVP